MTLQFRHGVEQARDPFFPQQTLFGGGSVHGHVPQCSECDVPSHILTAEVVAQGVASDREDPHPRRCAGRVVTMLGLQGMEEGVEGGVVGGVPGGVLGGVIGGTGDGVVMDYDQGPRPIKITQPKYPPEAFVKKIEGTVEVEILIDITGRVSKARVVRSIPALDEAARQTVLQWIFSPAIKNGRPVATVASAPVTFRIF